MRTADEITSQFTRARVTELTEVLLGVNCTKEQQLEAALQFLGIDSKAFPHIPFKTDKLKFLQYKFILTHFEFYRPRFESYHWPVLDEVEQLTTIAKDVILNNPVIAEHQDLYCKSANGLRFIHHRTGKVSRMDDNTPRDYSASIIQTGKKPGGIEPGFMAEHQQDLIEIFINYCSIEQVSDFVHIYEGNIEKVYNRFKDEMPKNMYKLDYHTDEITLEYPGKTAVYLTEDDVKRTNNIKRAYSTSATLGFIAAKIVAIAKKSTSGAINEDAVLETLANDLISIIMQVQNQTLFKTEYQNLDLKILACCEWVKNAKSYGKESDPLNKEKSLETAKPLCEEEVLPLFGGVSDTDNYRVRHLVVPQNGITALNDNRVLNTSQYYLPLLFTGDYDKIGSKGQNMLVVPKECDFNTGLQFFDLVGIDFGHTLKEDNRIIADMTTDGRFLQPTKNPFKNFTALSDGSLSEKMQGLLLLARSVGYPIDEAVVASYGDTFNQKYQNITANESNALCDSYIHAFQLLSKIDESHASMYEQLMNSIAAFKKRMNKDAFHFLTKFEPYLHLEANAVDFIDNINKFSAAVLGKTQLVSNNKQVGLHHLCIDLSHKDNWVLSFDENTQYYTCKYTGQDKATLTKLEQAFNNQSRGLVVIKDNSLQFSIHKNSFSKIQQSFQETTIKKHFHRKEHEAIEKAKMDLALQDLIKAPWFKKYHMELSLKAHPTNTGLYELVISYGKATTNLRWIIKRNFGNLPFKNEQHKIIYKFDNNSLQNVYELITEIQKQNNFMLKNPGKSVESVSSSGFFRQNTNNNSPSNTNSNRTNYVDNPVILFKESIEIICAIMTDNRATNTNQNNALTNLSSYIYKSTSSIYNSKQNPTSSAALLIKLNDYLAKCKTVSAHEYTTLFDDVLDALNNRLSYIESSLLPNAKEEMLESYNEELALLKAAIEIGNTIETAPSKLEMLSNSNEFVFEPTGNSKK